MVEKFEEHFTHKKEYYLISIKVFHREATGAGRRESELSAPRDEEPKLRNFHMPRL